MNESLDNSSKKQEKGGFRRKLGTAARVIGYTAAGASVGYGMMKLGVVAGREAERRDMAMAQAIESDPKAGDEKQYYGYVRAKLISLSSLTPQERLPQLETIAKNFLRRYDDLVKALNSGNLAEAVSKYTPEDIANIQAVIIEVLADGKPMRVGATTNRLGIPVLDSLVSLSKGLEGAQK